MLNPLNLGLSGGIIWGITMFICTILAVYTGYSANFLANLTDIYPGYTVTLVGSIIGLIYGFIDAFVAFFLLAWIYNKLNKK